MKTGRIIVYWVLLLVPTLVIGAVAFNLLQHEEERIERAKSDALADRIRGVAENIRLTVTETDERLRRNLRSLSSAAAPSLLRDWQRDNPLVRNVFIWDPHGGLVVPDPPSTREEERFVERYEALFSGRIPWTDALQERPREAPSVPGIVAQTSQQQQPSFKRRSPRQELWDLTKSLPQQAEQRGQQAPTQAQGVAPSQPRGGCIPWFYENRLHLLLWTQAGPEQEIRGLELETMALLSRLIAALPANIPEGHVIALIDDAGQVVHQAGDGQVSTSAIPIASAPVGSCLPHWSVALYTSDTEGGPAASSFALVSGLLVTVVVIAILAGGSLLLWQAYSNLLDARRKTTFVSNVSHELKTPLTSIRMYAELLSEKRVQDAEKQQRYLDVIVRESQRLTRLVNNVLDFSRIEQDRKNYHPESVDVVDTVNQIIDGQLVRLEEAGLHLQKDLGDQPQMIHIDRDALGQVVLNLVDNAVKYAADGGVLTVKLEQAADRLCLHILDRGPGIPHHRCQDIFKTFHRLDDSLTTKQPGSGLGLSIAQRMMQDQGGDLTCHPRAGGGTRFTVVMPRDDGQ